MVKGLGGAHTIRWPYLVSLQGDEAKRGGLSGCLLADSTMYSSEGTQRRIAGRHRLGAFRHEPPNPRYDQAVEGSGI